MRAFADSGYPPNLDAAGKTGGALADRRTIFHREQVAEGAGREGRATTKNKEFQTCRKQTRKKY